MTDYTARIYLAIRGDFNPFEFTESIGLTPDVCIDKHSRNPRHQLPKTTLLDYADTRTSAKLIDLDKLADQVLEILEPHLDEFVSAVARFKTEVVLQIVLYFPTSDEVPTPIAGFSARVIRFLAALGGSIDIDSYRSDGAS
jgi:hypothetical protein